MVWMDNFQDNVVQEAGQNDLFVHASFQGAGSTLLNVG
mgnify:CR=1 FL=1